MEWTSRQRDLFDQVFESVLETLPPRYRCVLDEVPVIIDDAPPSSLLEDLDADPGDVCGLHTGIPITERSVEDSGVQGDTIHLFRTGIVEAAGGIDCLKGLREEIRITLLHELGHHFGLDEVDLEDLGYG